jgi:hypothetical protein
LNLNDYYTNNNIYECKIEFDKLSSTKKVNCVVVERIDNQKNKALIEIIMHKSKISLLKQIKRSLTFDIIDDLDYLFSLDPLFKIDNSAKELKDHTSELEQIDKLYDELKKENKCGYENKNKQQCVMCLFTINIE